MVQISFHQASTRDRAHVTCLHTSCLGWIVWQNHIDPSISYNTRNTPVTPAPPPPRKQGKTMNKHLSGKKKRHKHKLFGPDFPRTFLTLTPGRPWVKKFLRVTGAAEKAHFWVRTSTIFGADVHDPKGSRKTLCKKSLR